MPGVGSFLKVAKLATEHIAWVLPFLLAGVKKLACVVSLIQLEAASWPGAPKFLRSDVPPTVVCYR